MIKHDLRYVGCAVAVVAALGSACSGRVEEAVAYDVYRVPPSEFKGMSFLGVAKPKDLDGKHVQTLTAALSKCGQYQKVNALGKTFALESGDREKVQKKLKADIASYQDARYVHGVLVIEPLKRTFKTDTASVKYVAVKEGVDHSWYESAGYTADLSSGLLVTDEIAPKMQFAERRVQQKQASVDLSVRITLYNKANDAIVFDRVTRASAALATYSTSPKLSIKALEAELWDEIMARAQRFACPKVARVERQLLAEGSETKADLLIQQGIEIVDDSGDWGKAADMWKKAVLIDKQAAFAYHNLGVYYERRGDLPAAMEEFEKAKRRGGKSTPKQYDVSLVNYRPKLDPVALEPRIYAAGGAGWVTITGGRKAALGVGRTYSVYRLRRAGEDFRFDGVALTEVGKVTIVKAEPPFMLARVTQFLDPQRVEAGDVLVVD
jgi:tetratricopeptide (TPR) repeat protein